MRVGEKKHQEAKATEEEELSSSEDDENAELLTEELEKGFLKVLSRLKKKDSDLYKESVNYFSLEDPRAGATTGKKQTKQSRSRQTDYKKWLTGQINNVEDPETKKELEALHDFWTNPDINKEEQFLRDYILNKKFLEHDDSFNLEKELQKLSEEEEEEQEQAIFEEKYNCRFENPDKSFLQKYPHTMKKASGKKRKHDSYTENNESNNKIITTNSITNKLKDHDKPFEKFLINSEETNAGKKRKHNATPDIKTKIRKTNATIINDESKKKPKNKILTTHKSGENTEEKQQRKDAMQSTKQAMKENDTKTVSAQHLNKKENNKSHLNKLQEIFHMNDKKLKKDKKQNWLKINKKSKKDKKQTWIKKQNIKQPGIMKKRAKKVKDRSRKPRHRSLKTSSP